MTDSDPASNKYHPRFHEDLVGLDPLDPEAQAFATHLDRMERCEPAFTVEASIRGTADFAESSNRIGGLRWWIAAAIVSLIMIGVLLASWEIITRTVTWLSE